MATLMALVGRCVLRYQRIEHTLKLLLPHLVKPGRDLEESVPDWREFLDSKFTLGPLVEKLKPGLNSERPDDAHSYLAIVVAERNDLVHHFFTKGRALTGTSDALENAIVEVRRRLENALPLEQTLLVAADRFAHDLEYSLATDLDDEAPHAL
ncbi:MAG: hypothetical protein V4669_18885 [Pseudomonadota bacterium]